MKYVLILSRMYPYKKAVVEKFKSAFTLVYDSFFKGLDVLTEDEIKAFPEDGKEMVCKLTAIEKLYKDEHSAWTANEDEKNGECFWNRKQNGITAYEISFGDVVYFVLPCTGSKNQKPGVRVNYTKQCVDAVCSFARIGSDCVYVIAHSLDTAADNGSRTESFQVLREHVDENSVLMPLIDAGHLYSFHHETVHKIYAEIVHPVCLGEEPAGKIDQFFNPPPADGSDEYAIWNLIKGLNDKEY